MVSKLAIFVDVQNIYYTTKQAFGRSFDYRKFWALFDDKEFDDKEFDDKEFDDKEFDKNEITLANAYAIASNDDGQRRFQDALRNIGFTVKLKPYIQRADGSAKGDWDVGITLDVVDAAANVDRIVLLSGDGDFSMLLDKIRHDHGVKTQVYGVQKLTAKLLIDSADEFVPIDEKLLI